MATRMYVCESAEHPSNLLSALNDQRLKGLLCDITVRVQGHLFKAHINVLTSTMGYFSDLFLKSGKEKSENVIEIPIIVNSTGFAKILDFVYTAQLCLSQSTVMQVLCSACYLQIPYVVEKCQEFISTHGRSTSRASMSDVAVPFLQNLQQKARALQNQNSNAGLTLLSQLGRLSKTSKNGFPRQSESVGSPQPQQTDRSQDLVNLPSSPDMRGCRNGEDNKSSNSDGEKNEKTTQGCNMITLKREKDVATPCSDNRQVHQSNSPPAFLNNGFDEHISKKLTLADPSNNKPLDLIANSGIVSGDRDLIDHKSLADYFSPDRSNKQSASMNLAPYSLHDSNDYSNSTRQIALTSRKSVIKSRLLGNMASNRTFTIRKEKPKKEFRCEYCDKLFGRQQHLKRHILTHTGERPYPCTYCDKRFRRSEHLKHHMASHVANAESSSSRKKQKKPTRCDDAVALSNIIVNHKEADGFANTPNINLSLVSAPVVLPSMFTEADRSNQSPEFQQQIEIENVGLNHVLPPEPIPVHEDAQQCETALNLCTGSPNGNDLNLSEDQELNGLTENGQCASFDVGLENQASPPTSSPQLSPTENNIELMDENPTDPGLMGMEGSEVLTSDLKRLIAAMDQ